MTKPRKRTLPGKIHKGPHWFHGGMRRHFKMRDCGRFVDMLMLQAGGGIRIDIFAFDDWLHREHGDYEDQGMSMREVIEKHYGKEAAEFVKQAI
jgi:hypothetical protein